VRNFALDPTSATGSTRTTTCARSTRRSRSRGRTGIGTTRDELALVTITNAYRVMFGRRALAYNDKLWRRRAATANGCSAPARSATSRTIRNAATRTRACVRRATLRRGRELRGRRVRRDAAHSGWCQSSGHHRNLLFESHTEMAGGQAGGYWTENFGGAHEYAATDPLNAPRPFASS